MYKMYYRCNLCQELYSDSVVKSPADAINAIALLASFGSTKSLLGERSLEMKGIHRCSDGSFGLSEFIGFRYAADPVEDVEQTRPETEERVQPNEV